MAYKSNIKKVDRTQEAVDFPKVILIDNCNACNLACSMCDHPNVSKYRKIQLMDYKLYQKIIDEIALENPVARVWEIFFGDPFMCGDIARRVQYAKDKGLQDVVLNSNGVKMTPARSKKLIEAGLDAMYVGIDSISESTYNKIRIGGNYQRAVENVLSYKKLLKNYGKKHQEIYVQFVVSDLNEQEVEDFKNFWLTRDIKVKIRPKVSWAGLVEAQNLVEINQSDRKPCYWLMQTINICADGQVALCSVDVHCRVNCGDINTQTIKEVWHDRLEVYRDMHKNLEFNKLPKMCRLCKDWQSGYADFFENDN